MTCPLQADNGRPTAGESKPPHHRDSLPTMTAKDIISRAMLKRFTTDLARHLLRTRRRGR